MTLPKQPDYDTHYQYSYEGGSMTERITNLWDLISKFVGEEKKNPHLDHSTRDEDSDGGWCDTCQTTFQGNTLSVYGYNSFRTELEERLRKVEVSEEKITAKIIDSKIFNFAKKVGRKLAELMKAEYDDPEDKWLKDKSKELASAILSYLAGLSNNERRV